MVMEFVSGVNLEQFIERHRALERPVPIDFAVFIASRVARGLTYAHQKTGRDGQHLNIVHRDVNPKVTPSTRERRMAAAIRKSWLTL